MTASGDRDVVRRPVRSYVLRQGRVSPAQARALDTLASRYCVPFGRSPLDFARTFGRNAPVVVEIGCGMGETTAAIAAAHRETDFLGIEVHAPGIGAILNRIEAGKLANLRMVQHDAVEVVDAMIPPGSLAGVHVYFPDPWPKKRHHKRRLLKPTFVHALAQRIVPGGYLHAATDWAPYAEEILATLSSEALLANTAQRYAPRPAWRPQTKFETRGLKLGHEVFDLVFHRAGRE
ncbi:MAG: tRNA (guanosine(46)-N7)-methyltransferase TrmB [Betaproteobacteria bacterium]